MKKILISPYSRKLINNKINAKNYPFWENLVYDLKNDFEIIQLGIENESLIKGISSYLFNLNFEQLKITIKDCDLWISVDNFMGHLGSLLNKKGIVIFGKSDPLLFGYNNNINILKDRKFLRKRQFECWQNEIFDKDVFVESSVIKKEVYSFFNKV